jgi:hypothetical protein
MIFIYTHSLVVPSAGTSNTQLERAVASSVSAQSLLAVVAFQASQNVFLDSEDAENSASTPENTHRFLTDPSISPVLEVANDEVDSADNNDNIEVIKNEPIEPIAAGDNLMNCSGDNFHRLFRPHFTDISQLALATSFNQVRFRPFLEFLKFVIVCFFGVFFIFNFFPFYDFDHI